MPMTIIIIIILGSWAFHQYFDGTMTEDKSRASNLPLRPTPNEPLTEEMIGEPPQKRTRVYVLVECRSPTIAQTLGSLLKGGSERVSEDTWKTLFMYKMQKCSVSVSSGSTPPPPVPGKN